VYDLNGICEECGFVLDKRNQIDVPQWAVDASDETATGQEGWFEFCRVTNSTEQQLAEAFGLIEELAYLTFLINAGPILCQIFSESEYQESISMRHWYPPPVEPSRISLSVSVRRFLLSDASRSS